MLDTFIGVCGLAIGVYGILVGAFESARRRRLSEVVRAHIRGYPGDLAKIHESCHFGWVNSRAALDEVSKMENSPEKTNAIRLIALSIGDARGGKDASINLFNQLLTFQKAQFGTRRVVHPQTATLTLMKAEAESQLLDNEQEPEIEKQTPMWKFWKRG